MTKAYISDTRATVKGGAPSGSLSALLSLLMLWRWRARSRRELSGLTARQMHDAGLDPEIVRRESNKPFWDA
jgi:uncharacterized protein YjiS (DUF1127 family)